MIRREELVGRIKQRADDARAALRLTIEANHDVAVYLLETMAKLGRPEVDALASAAGLSPGDLEKLLGSGALLPPAPPSKGARGMRVVAGDSVFDSIVAEVG